jgi:hypothetical protein
MFWRKKEEPEPSQNELHKRASENSNINEKEPIYAHIGEIQRICLKKCVNNLIEPLLNPAEKSCLDRCAFKFRETLEFGHNLLLNIDFKIRDTNNNIPMSIFQNPPK